MNYFDKKVRIDLQAGTCLYMGMTMTLDNDNWRCKFPTNDVLFMEIDIDNYELINIQNVHYSPLNKEYIIDFYKG